MYALLMSFINMGKIFGKEWGSLLTIYLDISDTQFDNLWILVLLCSGASLVPLVLLPVLVPDAYIPPMEKLDDEDDVENGVDNPVNGILSTKSKPPSSPTSPSTMSSPVVASVSVAASIPSSTSPSGGNVPSLIPTNALVHTAETMASLRETRRQRRALERSLRSGAIDEASLPQSSRDAFEKMGRHYTREPSYSWEWNPSLATGIPPSPSSSSSSSSSSVTRSLLNDDHIDTWNNTIHHRNNNNNSNNDSHQNDNDANNNMNNNKSGLTSLITRLLKAVKPSSSSTTTTPTSTTYNNDLFGT
jgi:hypothetical protein